MGTNYNYDDTDHQVIFDNINGGAGSQPLQELGRAWQQLADDIGVTAKSYVEKAIGGIIASREGGAADAAAAGTARMLPWMDDAASTARAVSRRVQDQADYWVTARDSVPAVPPAPQSASFLGSPTEWVAQHMDWIPGLTTEEEKAAQRQQDAAEQARQAMRVYQTSTNGNLDAAPAFAAPQSLDGAATPSAAPDAGHGGAGGAVAAAGTGGPAAGVAAPLSRPAAATGQPIRPAAGPPPGPPPERVRNATGADSTPSQRLGPRWGPGPDGPATSDVRGRDAPATTGGPPGGLRGAAAGAGSLGVAAGRGGGPGGFGPAGGAPRFGPRPGTGAGIGTGTGALAPEDATSGARGGAAARGPAGSPGYAAPIGPGSGGGQDREHRRRYLVESESHAIVGDLPPTAPPVIGDDQDR